jgi:hypothetical protein
MMRSEARQSTADLGIRESLGKHCLAPTVGEKSNLGGAGLPADRVHLYPLPSLWPIFTGGVFVRPQANQRSSRRSDTGGTCHKWEPSILGSLNLPSSSHVMDPRVFRLRSAGTPHGILRCVAVRHTAPVWTCIHRIGGAPFERG